MRSAIGAKAFDTIAADDLTPAQPDYLRPWFSSTLETGDDEGEPAEIYAHVHAGKIVVEFIGPDDPPQSLWDEDRLRQSIISQLVQPNALGELARVSANIVRTVTGFDRVMIYRFAEDKHGEVIAESTDRPDSFLGLHYPASDIPEPARRHFLSNIIRNIPDIDADQVPIYTATGETADVQSSAPLDLTYAKLRGVSPVHIEYLQNMGVRASLSVSLTTNNRLWGLIACHHYDKHELRSSRIRFTELLGATISTLLQSIENTSRLQHSISAERLASAIEADAARGETLPAAALNQADRLLALFNASAAVIRHDGRLHHVGKTPEGIPFQRLSKIATNGIALTSNLSSVIELSPAQWEEAAGAAYLELSDDGSDYLVLTRQHFIEEIRWAGKPEKIVRSTPNGTPRLSPRGSFAVWSEERVGHSEPFLDIDREAFQIIRRALFAINSLERERAAVRAKQAAEQEKERFRHALLEASRRSSLGELASALTHELSQPLFAVSNYVTASKRELENLEIPISENIGTMMQEAVADAVRAADLVRRLRDFFTGADLEREAVEIQPLLHQGIELALVAGALPNLEIAYDLDGEVEKVWADPVQISLVILNLVRNSVTAMSGTETPYLLIETRKSGDHAIFTFRDNGGGIPEDLRSSLFEPFHRSTTSGMGIGLSLCRSIIEAHLGRIWTEPAASGAIMKFSLPISPIER